MTDTLLAAITKFYGVDWAAMALLLSGMLLVARKKRLGFLVLIVGSFFWTSYAVMTGSVAQIVTNLILVIVNGFGYWNWQQEEKT